MGQSFYQAQMMFNQELDRRQAMMDHQIMSLTSVLKEIVGKELLRGQALHKVLMDKAIFTDAELATALKTLMDEAKADLEAESKKIQEEKKEKIEILIPANVNVTPKTEETHE